MRQTESQRSIAVVYNPFPCFAEFGRRSAIISHPFNFAASIYYSKCILNRAFVYALIVLAAAVVYQLMGAGTAITLMFFVSAGEYFRGSCPSCAEIQGIALAFLVVGVVLGSMGIAAAIGIIAFYVMLFVMWLAFALTVGSRVK